MALSPQVSIGLDQTRLGRSVRNVRVHLQGSYTPLPSSVAGEVVVSIGSDTVERWPTDNNGVIDRWVNVPDRLLQRYTNLGVAVNLAGNTGRCGEFQPVKLVIDGATVVTSQAAMPPAPPGFQSLPQAMLPRLQVGIADDAFADTVRGAQMRRPLHLLRTIGWRSFVRFNLVVGGTPIIAVLNLAFWLITVLWFLGQPAAIGAVFPGTSIFPPSLR